MRFPTGKHVPQLHAGEEVETEENAAKRVRVGKETRARDTRILALIREENVSHFRPFKRTNIPFSCLIYSRSFSALSLFLFAHKRSKLALL